LLISCGAALFNLRLAIRVTGHDPVVWLLPDQTASASVCAHCGDRCGVGSLLASVEIILRRAHPATITEQRLYEAIPQRHTARQPFGRPIRMNMLAELEQVARMEGAEARLLPRGEARHLIREAAQADGRLSLDPRCRAEIGNWAGTDLAAGLGVPLSKFGPKPKEGHYPPVRDFGPPSPDPRAVRKFEKHPQLIALETRTDTPSDWLRAGQALQRLLLTATYYGVQASFLTQQLEDKDRDVHSCHTDHQWWPWPRPTQMIIRVGGQTGT